MGRQVCIEDSAQTRLKELSAIKGYVVGLILGQNTGKKDVIVFFAPTSAPSISENSVESNVNEDIKVVEPVDDLNNFQDKWILSHGKNLSHMLPGGVRVLGVFIVTNDAGAAESAIINKLKSLSAYAFNSSKSNEYLNSSPVSNQLLLYYSSKTNKYVCNSYDASSLNSPLHSVDFKFSKNHSSWFELHSSINLSNFGPQNVPDNSAKSLEELFKSLLGTIKGKLKNCKWSFDGKFLKMTDELKSFKQLQESDGKGDSVTSSNIITVNIYCSGSSDMSATFSIESSKSNSSIPINIQGTIVSRVFMNSETLVEEVISSIQEDILRSCYKKFEMQWETSDDLPKNVKSKQVYTFPRRILCSLPSQEIKFSEYLFPEETSEDASLSFQQLLGFPVKTDFITDNLETAPIEKENDFSKNESSFKKEKTVKNSYIIIGIVLSVSILIISILMQLLLK